VMMSEYAGRSASSQILDKVEKVWQDQNGLAYFASSSVGKKKKFYNQSQCFKTCFHRKTMDQIS